MVKGFVLVAILCGSWVSGQDSDFDKLLLTIFQNSSSSTTAAPALPPVTSVVLNPTVKADNPSYLKIGDSCGDGKECVQHYLCKDGSIVKDGRGVIDIRLGGDEEKKECHYLDACCSISNKVKTPVIVIPKENKGCGFRNVDGVGFKITGDEDNEAQFGEFPWMVAVLLLERGTNIYQCGGSLLSPSVILTAAHCVKNRKIEDLRIRAGEWDTKADTEILPHQDRQVINKVVHPDYDSGALFNDVALLFTDFSFQFEENVKPICLPPAGMNFDFARCYATGWGKNEFGKDGKYQVILKKIDLPVIPNDQCQRNLRETRAGKYFELHKSFICAGGELGKDTCKGDGGSPLVCPVPNSSDQFYQAGIVAWGVGCGQLNVPGVYASVSYLRPWIDEQLKKWDIDPTHYSIAF